MKHVREGERGYRRKLKLSPEIKAENLPVWTKRPKVLVQARGRGTRACTNGNYDS
jgi:hypothetical protein